MQYPTEAHKTKMIFIMGGGRSGSTILSIVIGNMPGVFFMGELHKWNLYNGRANSEIEYVRKFWDEVYQEMDQPEKYLKNDFFKYLEYHSSMFFFPWFTKKKLVNEFHFFTSMITNIIKKKSGAEYLLDSSHYPFRAFWLNKNKYIDLKIIYLYRNPVHVVESFGKKNIEQNYKNPIHANLFLTFIAVLSEIMFRYFSPNQRIKIRYEDLIEDPSTTIDRLKKFLSLPDFKIDLDNLKTGFIFQSNRIRQQETIALDKKINPSKLNIFWKFYTYIIQSPFLLINKRKSNSRS